MNSLDAEPLFSGLGSGGGSRFVGRSALMGEFMKGGADPLLSQDTHSVKYSSLIDNEASNDFPEEKLMPSNSLYSLYLLQPNADDKTSSLNSRLENNHSLGSIDEEHRNSNGRASDSEEHIDVLTLDHCSSHSQPAPSTNGLDHDALFEGMPFYELKGREVGPCAYCNMWRAIRFLSYCGNYPFCSVSCTKKFAVYKREKGELLEKASGDLDSCQTKIKVPTLFEHDKPQPLFPPRRSFLTSKHSKPSGDGIQSIPNGQPQLTNGHSEAFEWSTYLQEHDTEAAPVRCFCHAPLCQEWKSNQTGAMIEVHNRDPEESPNSFWVARVIQMAGYIARLRFEGYGMDSSHDFALHLVMAECYPVNGAVKMGHVMKPPKGVLARLGNNWQEHLARVAHSGSPTIVLPKNKEDYLECKFKAGMVLEVAYKQQISHTIPASVVKTVANRVHVQYENCKDLSRDFWFHESSPWIHPVGWSQRVGHPIIATAAYKCDALDKGRNKKTGAQDAPWEIFNIPSAPDESQFRKGMKLEVVDPLRLGTICVATVMEVMRDGYLMIGVDGCLEDTSSWFCCHYTAPSLLPVGFCEYHKIDLQPPRGFEHFDWVDYLRITESVSAPIEIFYQKKEDRGFKVGHKLEAVDLIESSYICVATVTKVAGPLLRIHFDGWDRSYDQWMDCDSPDIVPVGWCEMVSYPLQPPRIHESQDYISITPVCKPPSRRKHYPPGEKRRLSLTPALERMSKEPGRDDKLGMLPSVYSFSDEENSHEGAPLPPPPKKQLLKKQPHNRSNLKLKMPRPTAKHNGKGRPKEAPASHHNYALPVSREGASNQGHEHSLGASSTLGADAGSNLSGSDLVNGLVKREATERGEFIVEVEKGIANCHHPRPDTSLSSLDSPPLSAESSSGSAHQHGGSESRNSDDNPRKFTMANWSNVEKEATSTKMLSTRPFKNFGKTEGENEFGMETYDFADATAAPSVTIPSVSKQDKKKKKKKKKNKKKKDREKDKEKEKGKDKDKKDKDKDKDKEKHKKDGSKKKKSKVDKERKKERRKERAKAKAKASQLQTLLNLPADLPMVMQTDQSRGEENVLNHILNDQHISQGAINFDRTSKVKFSLTPGSGATPRTDPVKKDQPVVADKLSTLDRLLAKPANEDISLSATSIASTSQTSASDVTVLTSVSGSRTIPLLEERSLTSSSVTLSTHSSTNSKDFAKPIMQRTILTSEKSKPRSLFVRDHQKKADASSDQKKEDPLDDPYNFDAELGDSLPSKPTKEKSFKNIPSMKKDSIGQVSSVKAPNVSNDSSRQVFTTKGTNVTSVKTLNVARDSAGQFVSVKGINVAKNSAGQFVSVKGPVVSQDSEENLASQTQVQKIIQSVNSSLATQTMLASKEASEPKRKAKAGKTPAAVTPAAVTPAASVVKTQEATPEELRQLHELFMQEKFSDIIAKQQQKQARKKGAIADNKAAMGMILQQNMQQNLQGSQVGFRNPMPTSSMATSPIPNLRSPQPGIMGTMNTSEALVQSLMQRAIASQPPLRHPPPPPLPPSNLPLRPDQLHSPSQLSPSHPMFPGFRPPSRDACNMVALSRPPKEFCMPINVRSPSPTGMVPGLTHPPQMSPTSLPATSPTGMPMSLSPTVTRPPPTYGAHLSQAMRGIPRSPVESRPDFLPFPAQHQHRVPVDQGFPMPHPRVGAPQRLPPLQSLLMHQRYPPPPHPKRAAAALGSPQMANPPTHILPPPSLPPPPSVPPPPYTLHQAMTAQQQAMTAQQQAMTAQQQSLKAQQQVISVHHHHQQQQQQQSPLPSPIGRHPTSSCTSSPQTSPSPSSEPSPVTAAEQQPAATLQTGPSGDKVNPWMWGIAEVVQFLAETGEGSCADCFYRQSIDGQKLMSLSKEQLVKLTGMKVAPSLKIYEQIVKLRSRFPTSPPGLKLHMDSVAT